MAKFKPTSLTTLALSGATLCLALALATIPPFAGILCAAEISAVTDAAQSPPPAIRDELVALAPQIAKIRQNIRPFDTISLTLTEERLDPEGKWIPIMKRKILWDRAGNHLKMIEVELEPNSCPFEYNESVYANEKSLRLTCLTMPEEKGSFNPKRKISPHGRIDTAIYHTFNYASLSLAWLYYMEPPRIPELGRTNGILFYDALGKIGSDNFNFVEQKASSGYLHFSEGPWVFQFDKSGLLRKREWWDNDKKTPHPIARNGIEATEFVTKNGWTIPVTFVHTSGGKIVSRERIDPASVEINKKFTPKEFLVTIPAGTRVSDGIKDSDYTAGKDITTSEIWNLDETLKSLFPKKEIEKAVEKAIESTPAPQKGDVK